VVDDIWRVKPSGKARQFLTLQGVPSGLLEFSFDPTTSIANADVSTENKGRIINPKQQLAWLNTILDDCSCEPAVFLFTSEQQYLMARRVATIVFWRYLANSLNYPRTFKASKPFWHIPNLEFKNPVLNNYMAGEHSQPNLLVLDSLSVNMPAVKASKVHDLLQAMCDRPRLLLVHGAKSYQYCIDQLGVRPNKLINFADPKRRRIV
jgi:hypothetical protein